MSGSFLSRTVDAPVNFKDPMDFGLEGKLETARLFLPDAGGRELVLTVWFDYWVFKRIDRNQFFGYSFDTLALADGQAFELTSTLPIQLELRAESAALAALDKLEGDALLDAAVAALRGDDRSSPLLDVANYRFLGIYQEKEMAGVKMLSGADSVFKKQPAG